VRARCADGEQFSRLIDEQRRLATDMTCHYASFRDIRQWYALSEIESGR
jgi:hypothetical protein